MECSICHESEPAVSFYKRKNGSQHSVCRSCAHAEGEPGRPCIKCGKRPEEVEFYSRTYPSGSRQSSMCKRCHIEGARQSYERSKSNPVKYLFDRVRYRAKQEGTEFTITEADIVIPEVCPITEHKLLKVAESPQHDDSPSIDRLDSTKGYVPGNVTVMSRRGNFLKGSGTAEEHERIAAWMRAQGLS